MHRLLWQRPFPAGVGIAEDQGRDKPGMMAVEPQYNNAAPGEAGDVRLAERERFDQLREAVRVVLQAEICWHIRRAARPRLVPSHDRELVGQSRELRLRQAPIRGGTVHEHQRRSLADTLVGDLEPVRPDTLHRRNLRTPRKWIQWRSRLCDTATLDLTPGYIRPLFGARERRLEAAVNRPAGLTRDGRRTRQS